MMWRCQDRTKNFGSSLYFPYHLDSGYNGNNEKYSLDLHSLLLNEEEACTHKEKALSCWLRPVTAYSVRVTSLECDKLNALAGIASHPSFCNALGPGYFAGQWQYNLARQLTWRTSSRHRTIPENENHALHRSLQYRAPSWSWASLDGGIIHFDFSYDDEDKAAPTMICDILGRLTTPAYLGLKPFGEISSAQVKLHSPVRVAWFNPSTSNIFLLSESTFAKSKSLAPENEAITFEETWQHHMNEFILKHPDVDISGDESEATHGTDFRNMCGTHDEIGCYGSFLVLCVAITMENLTLYPYELEWV